MKTKFPNIELSRAERIYAPLRFFHVTEGDDWEQYAYVYLQGSEECVESLRNVIVTGFGARIEKKPDLGTNIFKIDGGIEFACFWDKNQIVVRVTARDIAETEVGVLLEIESVIAAQNFKLAQHVEKYSWSFFRGQLFPPAK